jgi:ABC-type transporter Mla subunit MlaD
MAKQTQLKKTLAATEAQLDKAVADLQKAQKRVQDLTRKIPELRQAVNSLKVLVGEKSTTTIITTGTTTETPGFLAEQSPTDDMQNIVAGIKAKLPPEVAARMPAENLTGMGSVPATQQEPAEPLPDDEDFYLHPRG